MNKDLFDVKDKVIIITGGAGFLGKAYVKALSERGAFVSIFDNNNTNNPVDITDEKQIFEEVSGIYNKYKKIDVVINNAAYRSENFYNKFEDFPLTEWKKILDVNLTGMFIVSKAVVPFMKKQKTGSIINISSIYGLVGPDFKIYGNTGMTTPAVYSASKAGVLGLTRNLSTYLGEYNIRVNSITPGGVFNNQDKDFVENYSQKTPLKRMASPSDLTGAVIYLSSDASSYVTGQNLVVDGGWTAW